jgi:hypothetical protein
VTRVEEQLEVAVQALKDIENPIAALRRRLEPGCRLDGVMACQLAGDANYLKVIASKALLEIAAMADK